jgi:hypothetical protein
MSTAEEVGKTEMSPKELIEKIRRDVADTKEKGLSSIPVENLFAYLDELEKSSNYPANQLMPQHLEEFKADLLWQAGRTELFKSVILTAENALKSTILINGAATVALLAFIGNVWKADGSPLLIAIAGALYWFVIGVCSMRYQRHFSTSRNGPMQRPAKIGISFSKQG